MEVADAPRCPKCGAVCMRFQYGESRDHRGLYCLEESCGLEFAVVGGVLRHLFQPVQSGPWAVNYQEAGVIKHPDAR